jgi:hypothetical protein
VVISQTVVKGDRGHAGGWSASIKPACELGHGDELKSGLDQQFDLAREPVRGDQKPEQVFPPRCYPDSVVAEDHGTPA